MQGSVIQLPNIAYWIYHTVMSVPLSSLQSDEDKQLQEELEMMVERLGVSTTTTRTAEYHKNY